MIIGKSNERGGKRKIRRGNEGVAGIKWIKCYGREIFESLLQSMELSLRDSSIVAFTFQNSNFEGNYDMQRVRRG